MLIDSFSLIDFITINTIDELDRYSPQIDDFVNSERVCSNVYHQSDYLKSLFLNSPDFSYWEVCIVQYKNEIIGIIPSYIQRKKVPVKFSVYRLFSFDLRVLQFSGSRVAFVESLPEEGITHIIKNQLLRIQSPFDLAFIESLTIDDSLFRCFNGIEKYILKSASINPDIIHSIDFPDNWDSYLSSMSKKRRYNLKRNIKVLEKEFGDKVFFKSYEKIEDVLVFLSHLDEIYSNTWQAKTLGAKKRSGSVNHILDDVMAKSGCFLGYILFIDNKAVAFIRGYLHKGLYYFEEIGFDMAWSKYNVGNALNMMMLENLMSQSVQANNLDFGYGDNIYKQVLGNRKVFAINAYLYKRFSKASLIVFLIRTSNKVYSIIKINIEKFGLTEKVRRLIKHR